MGLDLVLARRDHDGERAGWSYGGFNKFRDRLAREIGIEGGLAEMVGFCGTRPWSEIDDPIVPFLDHSDCDGYLDYSACEKVAPRLREIMTAWGDEVETVYDRQMALRLCDMMDEVVAGEAECVVFS